MMNLQSRISPKIARRILQEAEESGTTVENYLKHIAEADSENNRQKLLIRPAKIKYDAARSRKWLKQNSSKYIGKWIVLDGEKLIGFGDDPRPFVEQARKQGVKMPFVKFINDDAEPFI